MARNPTIERYATSTQTSAASIITLISFTMPEDDIACQVDWQAVGVEATGGQVTSYKAYATFDNPSGTVAKVGSTTTTFEIDEDTNVVFTEDTDGTNIRLRVTPSSDTTDWVAWATVTFLRL